MTCLDGVFVSQLIGYARSYSEYGHVFFRGHLLMSKIALSWIFKTGDFPIYDVIWA